jgi:hypothetical protein
MRVPLGGRALRSVILFHIMPVRRVRVLVLSVFATACSSSESTEPGECPSYVVTADAGTGVFGAVGDVRMDQDCLPFCTSDYPVCILLKDNQVRCQKGCA